MPLVAGDYMFERTGNAVSFCRTKVARVRDFLTGLALAVFCMGVGGLIFAKRPLSSTLGGVGQSDVYLAVAMVVFGIVIGALAFHAYKHWGIPRAFDQSTRTIIVGSRIRFDFSHALAIKMLTHQDSGAGRSYVLRFNMPGRFKNYTLFSFRDEVDCRRVGNLLGQFLSLPVID